MTAADPLQTVDVCSQKSVDVVKADYSQYSPEFSLKVEHPEQEHNPSAIRPYIRQTSFTSLVFILIL